MPNNPNWIQIGGSGTPVTAPTTLITPSNPMLLSVNVVDTTPDASGNPQKLVTCVYQPPFPIGTFTGLDVYLDAPDTSGGLDIADSTMQADGTIAALGIFDPQFIKFVARNIASE